METFLTFFHGQPPIVAVLAGTGFTFFMTALGAATVFFRSDKPSPNTLPLTLGFAAGIMIAASVWSLLLPAMEHANENGQPAWLITGGGFICGALFLVLLDKALPHWHPTATEPEGPKTSFKRTTLLVSAVTLHNIPEGMSVGLTFALAALSGDPVAFAGAATLALGMGIQNLPEGAAVSLPLKDTGMQRNKAFLIGALSGLVEPIFGVLTVLLLAQLTPILGFLLAFAAGAMIYVVIEELIPAAHLNTHSDAATLSVMAGFVLMMVLDTALG